jgi:hypothetical protein
VIRALFAVEWADGLITIDRPHDRLEAILTAFRGHGGEGTPVALQVHLSWAENEADALALAHDQGRTNVFAPPLCRDLATVEQCDIAATHVRPEHVAESVLVSADVGRHVAWIQEFLALGFDAVYLRHVGQDRRRFIDVLGEHVLPAL